mgnify:CR=1 FL=1
MAFYTIPGKPGKFYIPDNASGEKKYPCKDCFSCQMCSDERCCACIKRCAPVLQSIQPENKKNPSGEGGEEGESI